MGNFVSVVKRQFRVRKCKVIMSGLDAAGKTVILKALRLGGKVVSSFPIIGLNVEELNSSYFKFIVLEMNSNRLLWQLVRHYFQDTDALVFVVDSNDTERLEEARELLQLFLAAEHLKDVQLLVYCNKQDLPNALSVSDISLSLGLPNISDRKWKIQGCSAITSEGLCEGIDWIYDNHRSDSPRTESESTLEIL